MITSGFCERASSRARPARRAFGVVAVGAQQAEPGAGARLELVELRAFDELVLAIAEQREVIAREPLEERAGFRLEVLRQPAGRAQVGRRGSQALEHRGPIFDGGTHRAQRARETGLDRREDRARPSRARSRSE